MATPFDKDKPETEAIYQAAQQWKEQCLVNDGSLLWPENQVWTEENLQKIKECFIDQPDESKKNFEEKFKKQLEGQPKEVYQLAAECLYMYYLFPGKINYETKLEKLKLVCQWGNVSFHDSEVLKALKNGIGKTGTSFNTRKPFEIAYLILFAREIKNRSYHDRENFMEDHQRVKEIANHIRNEIKDYYNANVQMRHIVLHLLFPELYEGISSTEHKQKIFKHFKYLIDDPAADVDEGLFIIREKLAQQYADQSFSFYQPSIRSQWEDDNKKPDYFWLTSNPSIWSIDEIKDGGEVFYTAYSKNGNKRQVFKAFQEAKPGDRVLIYESSPSFAIVAEGEVVKGLHKEREEGFEEPVEGVSFRYIRDVGPVSWDQMVHHPKLKDSSPIRIRARGSLFSLTREEFEEILKLEKEDGRSPLQVNFDQEIQTSNLYFENKDKLLNQVRAALKAGKHIILVGPPGTGKSKLAQAICRSLDVEYEMATATSDWSTYETIGGYFPDSAGKLHFQPGLFLKCVKESGKPQNKWLIMDELNRADIDKAFGSLFSVLTGDSITLNYTDENGRNLVIRPQEDDESEIQAASHEYVVPEDWRIIGTMNTYDKASLYEMSYAFMRRFAFIPVTIPAGISEDLIRNYLNEWNIGDEGIAGPLSQIWSITNRYRKIGPAIVRDMAEYILAGGDFTSTVLLYVFPQFEGVMEETIDQFIEEISELPVIHAGQLQQYAGEFLKHDY